jgi:V/A-type H+-transporting ATPase subunit K
VSKLGNKNVVPRALRLAAMLVFAVGFGGLLLASEPAATEAASTQVSKTSGSAIYYAIAATMGIASVSAAYAVGKIGAAVMGAAAEKPEIMGKAIAFVGLGEGIALFGFLISLFLIFRI